MIRFMGEKKKPSKINLSSYPCSLLSIFHCGIILADLKGVFSKCRATDKMKSQQGEAGFHNVAWAFVSSGSVQGPKVPQFVWVAQSGTPRVQVASLLGCQQGLCCVLWSDGMAGCNQLSCTCHCLFASQGQIPLSLLENISKGVPGMGVLHHLGMLWNVLLLN